MEIIVAVFAGIMGAAMAGIWGRDILSGHGFDAPHGLLRAREADSDDLMIWHWGAEFGTALLLVGGAILLFAGAAIAEPVMLLGLGALTYTSANSLGWSLARLISGSTITATVLSLPVLGVVALIAIGQGTGTAYLLAAVGLVAIGAIVALFAAILWSEASARRIGRIGDRVIDWAYGLFKKEATFDVIEWTVHFRDSTVDVIRSRWVLITGSSYLQQFLQFLILWAAVFAIQGGTAAPVVFVEAFVAYAFGRLASFIPITPGGLGTVDAAITAILVAFGAANSDALAAVMVWRVLTYFPQVFIGAGTFLYWRRRQSKAA